MQQTRLKRNSVFHAFLVLSTLLNVSVGTLQLHAQRIVSPEMMKEKFLHVSDTTKLMLYDKMFDADEYICKNPKLRNVRDMELPPSNWGLMIGNEQKGFSYENETRYLEADEKCILCWMGLRMGSVKEETSIRKKLKNKYGSILSANGKMEGIPAMWISDTIATLKYIKYYGGVYIGLPDFICVNEGELLEDYKVGEHIYERDSIRLWDYFSKDVFKNPCHTLYIQLFDLLPENSHSLDDKEKAERGKESEMLLLAYEVNKYCSLSFNRYHKTNKIPIYVSMRKDGRCEMTVLDERTLAEEDIPYLEELRNAFPKIPPLLFSPQFTIDGELMPGRILYATHNGAWTFMDIESENSQ